MFYATLAICLLSYADCEVENAVYAEVTAPVFNNMQECHDKMREYVQQKSMPETLKANEDYQVIVICDNR